MRIMAFDETWSVLQASLVEGKIIPNWSVAKGLLGDSFTVFDVGVDYIKVKTPGAINIQNIPKRDFETIYYRWSDYCARAVPRMVLRDLTRFSKYIISILRLLEQELGEQLP